MKGKQRFTIVSCSQMHGEIKTAPMKGTKDQHNEKKHIFSSNLWNDNIILGLLAFGLFIQFDSNEFFIRIF